MFWFPFRIQIAWEGVLWKKVVPSSGESGPIFWKEFSMAEVWCGTSGPSVYSTYLTNNLGYWIESEEKAQNRNLAGYNDLPPCPTASGLDGLLRFNGGWLSFLVSKVWEPRLRLPFALQKTRSHNIQRFFPRLLGWRQSCQTLLLVLLPRFIPTTEDLCASLLRRPASIRHAEAAENVPSLGTVSQGSCLFWCIRILRWDPRYLFGALRRSEGSKM